ncbi:MAG: 2-oxoacid:acceptor oxidoreductase family protein [Chloroflexi bacterium]|nr:2-oxoacid:acceptor oxidoreductase family protein [Chloroflexota bacterium]
MQGMNSQQPDSSLRLQIILAGIGGQGVVLASRVLSEMAIVRGLPILSAENHGMAKRGGSVVTTMKIGDFKSPMIRLGGADLLLGLTHDEALRNLPYLKRDGLGFVNSTRPSRDGLRSIDATDLALRVGNPRAANLVLLAFAFAHPGLGLMVDDLVAAVRSVVPERYLETNLKAIHAGVEAARS